MRLGSFQYALAVLLVLSPAAHAQEVVKDSKGREFVVEDDGTCKLSSKTSAKTKTPVVAKGFRAASWGMSREQVLKTEKGKPTEQSAKELLYHHRKVANLPAAVQYSFVDGQLVAGTYLISKRHTNLLEHIDEYDTLKKLLTSKYGEPTRAKTAWRNELYKDNPSDWGTAVALGHMAMASEWNVGETTISLMLDGGDLRANLLVFYVHAPKKAAIDAAREQRMLEGL